MPEEYRAESSAEGGSRLICVIPGDGDVVDLTRRGRLKIATVRGGEMSGAGGCWITAVQNVRARSRAGRRILKGASGVVSRSCNGTFLIRQSSRKRKGLVGEAQCEGQADFDLILIFAAKAKTSSKEQAKLYFLLCNGVGSNLVFALKGDSCWALGISKRTGCSAIICC